MAKINAFQIFYNEQTRQQIAPGFIPLDNSKNLRPDWFEFWVIRNYLHNNPLDNDAWYGFFSTKFYERSGIGYDSLRKFLDALPETVQVAPIAVFWDHIAYFINPFEQGECFHPGLLNASAPFFQKAGIDLGISSYVGHSQNTVFCNYFFAKPVFWRQWLAVADLLFEECETANTSLGEALTRPCKYLSGGAVPTQMKVFVQERIVSVLLATGAFKVTTADLSHSIGPNMTLFNNDPRTRRLLNTCETLKLEYNRTHDDSYLDMYVKVRSSIPVKLPVPSLHRG